MLSVTVGVHDPLHLKAKVYVPASGADRGFISLDAGELNLHFGGRGREAVSEARAVAAALEAAADELETALNAQAVTTAVLAIERDVRDISDAPVGVIAEETLGTA
jgi:hypothetical protein